MRHGWVRVEGHTRRNRHQPFERSDRGWLERVKRARKRRGLGLPYGRYAERAGTLPPVLTAPPGPDPPGPRDEADRAPTGA